ncbi:plasmid pRiA4b ORF-3 family protein [Burkholderia vietnamiensis]|uniref:Plasmid pRiA4b ORF-3 family protein n=1 Tax=Burkholderia vietnamiensis TaxID=60552 RepID=A0AAW7TCT1_BURVI|nr:plasmid pRiA4b ORF-3 family protein [Burkholderia vietnamiensis]MBH9645781.1 plasmid pRiA4b ORF-3 family protein [Burkholderia vietnamiensis]MBR8008945.1 plasmid pRiA4b ORF-3 family protein [Burkholderia vietnamiensis]MDN7551236.1 plasmid pRiA4b ORF-3 family protein [Burkholderia vietnamiensis]MDN7798543.1 plasmid pRiA4b ORF-3 family protein [Burkholderia vietnamiensis]MDN8044638.1 plasmid pRiA4b ORF-3 family protein [Burkholderia vietnamiensis]
MAKSFQRYTLHVQLLYIEPHIWRRIVVEGPDSLRKLHHILQAAFGWEDTHLHDFLIDGKTYAQFDIEAGLEFMDLTKTFDDRKAKLGKVLRPDSRIIYRYDFGDGWDHQIVIENIETIEDESWGESRVIDGARACPPEDVGGAPGYEMFLTTLRDSPDSEEADHYRQWIGPGFDPELFDIRAANAALMRLATNRWGNR